MGMAKKRFGLVKPSKGRAIVLFLAGLVIAAYGLAAVSYTHLDVYKRQVTCSPDDLRP